MPKESLEWGPTIFLTARSHEIAYNQTWSFRAGQMLPNKTYLGELQLLEQLNIYTTAILEIGQVLQLGK